MQFIMELFIAIFAIGIVGYLMYNEIKKVMRERDLFIDISIIILILSISGYNLYSIIKKDISLELNNSRIIIALYILLSIEGLVYLTFIIINYLKFKKGLLNNSQIDNQQQIHDEDQESK